MKQIVIINGPNLNLLGKREPGVYGSDSFESYYEHLREKYGSEVALRYYQSNHEGDLVDKLHEIGFTADGIVMNAAAYTHTSVAIADAVRAISTPVVEVHISNVYARESFRHKSYLAAHTKVIITGFGMQSYELAIQSFL